MDEKTSPNPSILRTRNSGFRWTSVDAKGVTYKNGDDSGIVNMCMALLDPHMSNNVKPGLITP